MKHILLLLLFIAQCGFAQYRPTAKGELVEHVFYALDYSEEHEQAAWVYYKLLPEHISGAAKRSDNFRSDAKVSTASASKTDYTSSGYDRGHLCPAADRSHTAEAISETFFMSNMSPQAPSFNRGGWKKLEELVRRWVISHGELHIATGGILNDIDKRIGANGVSVPKQYYKIVYAPKTQQMIAFIMPNDKLLENTSHYAVSVDEVERITGIDFFFQLEDSVEQRLESSISHNAWSW